MRTSEWGVAAEGPRRSEVLGFHGDPGTTVDLRRLIVERRVAGRPKAHIASAMGLSRTCVRTRIARYEVEGEAGRLARSSRPLARPTRAPAEVDDRIVELCTIERRGSDRLGAGPGVPTRPVARVLVRCGQPRPAAPVPMTGEVIGSPEQTAIGNERPRPGSRCTWRVATDEAGACKHVLKGVSASFEARRNHQAARPVAERDGLNRTLATEWPTGGGSSAATNAPQPLSLDSSTTTLDAATAHTGDFLRAAAWHRPDGWVDLERRSGVAAPGQGGHHAAEAHGP
jgi:hypothetical protein